jgi:hypothetical protein
MGRKVPQRGAGLLSRPSQWWQVSKMDNTFDSIYVVRKARYEEFVAAAHKLAIAAFTVPAFMHPELYKMVSLKDDIVVKVVWKPETTVGQIKEFDKAWFLKYY